MKGYEDEDDGTLKKFSHKKDITKDLFYNVFCEDMAELSSKLPKKDYSLLTVDIPYGFRMAGSSYDDEPFRFKQLEKMVKDFSELTTKKSLYFIAWAKGTLWLRHYEVVVLALRTLLGKGSIHFLIVHKLPWL